MLILNYCVIHKGFLHRRTFFMKEKQNTISSMYSQMEFLHVLVILDLIKSQYEISEAHNCVMS